MVKGSSFLPGETIFYSFQIAGYGESPVKKIRLSYRIEATDPRGVRIMEPIESIFDATLHDEDKQWQPKLRASLPLPPVAPSGTYKISTLVTDDISHLTAASETTVQVSGHDVPPSPELTIRNFTFHRTEEDAHPLPAAVFRPGDTLFARFDIAGFRYAEHNTIGVTYDVAVLNGTGKKIYSQEHAAEDKSYSYYPKPYVPGAMSLNLQPDMRPGDYTILVTVHDEVGRQTFEARQPFQLEK